MFCRGPIKWLSIYSWLNEVNIIRIINQVAGSNFRSLFALDLKTSTIRFTAV